MPLDKGPIAEDVKDPAAQLVGTLKAGDVVEAATVATLGPRLEEEARAQAKPLVSFDGGATYVVHHTCAGCEHDAHPAFQCTGLRGQPGAKVLGSRCACGSSP